MTADPRDTLVAIDDAGVVRALGKGSSAVLRARKGVHRLVPSPPSVLLLRASGASGASGVGGAGASDGSSLEASRVVRLAGEVAGPGVLCDVVSIIAQGGLRGELVVLIDDVARTVFFEGGNVVGGKSDVAGERLGEVMYKLGALTVAQVQAVIARMPFEKKRFGETAVSLGFVAREDLFHFAGKQTEEIFFATLLVARGSFFFLDGYDESRLTARLHFSAAALLMQGVSRMDEIKYFRERIPSQEHVPVRVDRRVEVPAELIATWPVMERVFNAIDSRRSVLEIGRACGLSEFEVSHALFQLLQSGLIAMNPPSPSSPEAVVAIHNDAIRRIFALASKHKRDVALKDHLARYASSVGILDEVFASAGPAQDGTLEARRVVKNLASLSGDDPQSSLSQWLHAYVAFALFDVGADVPKDEHAILARDVRKCLALLAPRSIGSVPPPGSTRLLSQRPSLRASSSVAPSQAASSVSPDPPPAAVAPFVPSSPAPPSAIALSVPAAPKPAQVPVIAPAPNPSTHWPPPRPFSTPHGQPIGVVSLRAPPRAATPEPSPLRQTQRLQAPLHPRVSAPSAPSASVSPSPPIAPMAPERSPVGASADRAISSANSLGKTQMNVQPSPPSRAPLATSPASVAPGAPMALGTSAPGSFDALALAEAAVPSSHVSQAPPPAPMSTPYVPSVPPPAAVPRFPSMDDLLDVEDAIATQQRDAAKPRRRMGRYVVIGILFCGSALGAYGVFIHLRAEAPIAHVSPKANASEASAQSDDESPSPEASKAGKETDEDSTHPLVKATASADEVAPTIMASTSASAGPSIVSSAVASAAPSAVVAAASASASSSAAAPSILGANVGVLRTPPASAGRRVFVDGKVVGEGPGPFTVACGPHVIKVGSAGRDQQLDVPCGGEITAPIL